jgi:hypothetical protein
MMIMKCLAMCTCLPVRPQVVSGQLEHANRNVHRDACGEDSAQTDLCHKETFVT